MKLDMGKAWTDATALLGANRDLVLVLAGLFFFLPYAVLALFLPEAITPPEPPPPANPEDMEAVMEAAMAVMTAHYQTYWWVYLGLTILQAIGMIALLALLRDGNRPTVGEAIKRGFFGLLPYIAAQIILIIGVSLAIGVPIGLLSVIGAGAVAILIAIPAMIYLFVKFSLVPAVIAIEQVNNPIKALTRSWQLTKGNSLMLFFFIVLLFIAIGVVSLIVGLIFGVVFAATGGQTELIGNGLVEGLISAVGTTIFVAVFAAVHRQLSGGMPAAAAETFE